MSSLYSNDWDHYLNEIQSNTKIKDERKRQLIKSVTALRKNLGEDWLSKSKDTNHPILWSLRTIHGGSADNLLSIWGNSLSTLEKIHDFDKILERIKKTDSFDSAVSELEIASRLVNHGCNLKIEQKTGDKRPDFFCKNGKYEFFVEVKTLATADETKKANNTTRHIMLACRPIFPTGIMFKPLSDPHLEEVESILREKTKYVIDKKTDSEVDIPNVLKLYLVSDESPDRIKKYKRWYRKQESLGIIRKGNHGLLGPSDNVRQDYRSKIRIDKFAKEKQIPINKMGILILVADFYFWNLEHVEKFVDVIIESVYELTNIPAIILWSKKVFADGKTNVTEKGDFIFIENYLYEEIKEDIVIVKNRFCKFKFDYDNLKELLTVKS